jgi:hypothetical protein
MRRQPLCCCGMYLGLRTKSPTRSSSNALGHALSWDHPFTRCGRSTQNPTRPQGVSFAWVGTKHAVAQSANTKHTTLIPPSSGG